MKEPSSDQRRHDDERVPAEAENLPAAPSDTDPSAASPPAPLSWLSKITIAIIGAIILVAGLVVATGNADVLDRDLRGVFSWSKADTEAEMSPVRTAQDYGVPAAPPTLVDYMHHPDRIHQPYMSGPVLSSEADDAPLVLVNQFRDLLTLYEERMRVDDNFTIRVVDNRSGAVLELYELDHERDAYESTGEVDWQVIDQLRRQQTRRLVQKWVDRGIPKPAVTVKWGRATQVKEAHERDLPFAEYEVRLAQLLGLSLLATEVGTVETFNRDRLVSPVGARSRYQMMPYILRESDIHRYRLPTASGRRVDVIEEWHPLLTMEPAFRLMRGYSNAVGHEIPGISAYHTGPGNIYKVYRFFLQSAPEDLRQTASVVDAYMWATTQGYEEVSSQSSFGPYSRGYVASAYGALKAVDQLPVDTTQTMRAERVRLRSGASVLLADLLDVLAEHGVGDAANDSTRQLYETFLRLNPHIRLPDPAVDGGVPTSGNIRLSATADGHPVRFFLPPGSARSLEAAGMDLLDPNATLRFDGNTFRYAEGGRSEWDREYERLVESIGQFGFNDSHRRRLFELSDKFEELAEANPTYFRRAQLDVIRTHERIWRTGTWEQMAQVTSAARGTTRLPAQPPRVDRDLNLPLSDLQN